MTFEGKLLSAEHENGVNPTHFNSNHKKARRLPGFYISGIQTPNELTFTLVARTKLFAVFSNGHSARSLGSEGLDRVFAGDFAVQNGSAGSVDDGTLVNVLRAGECRTGSQDGQGETEGDELFHDVDLRVVAGKLVKSFRWGQSIRLIPT
jgi:hypothetical protein